MSCNFPVAVNKISDPGEHIRVGKLYNSNANEFFRLQKESFPINKLLRLQNRRALPLPYETFVSYINKQKEECQVIAHTDGKSDPETFANNTNEILVKY